MVKDELVDGEGQPEGTAKDEPVEHLVDRRGRDAAQTRGGSRPVGGPTRCRFDSTHTCALNSAAVLALGDKGAW